MKAALGSVSSQKTTTYATANTKLHR